MKRISLHTDADAAGAGSITADALSEKTDDGTRCSHIIFGISANGKLCAGGSALHSSYIQLVSWCCGADADITCIGIVNISCICPLCFYNSECPAKNNG